MPVYYIGEHVVYRGTVEGGRRLNWVKRVPLSTRCSLPVFPD